MGKAGQHLGYLLPFILARYVEGIQVLPDECDHIPLGTVAAEEPLGSLVLGVADYERIPLFLAITQHQLHVAAHTGLAVQTVAERIGYIVDANLGFEILEVHFVVSHGSWI